jgi:hypothetical protein
MMRWDLGCMMNFLMDLPRQYPAGNAFKVQADDPLEEHLYSSQSTRV